MNNVLSVNVPCPFCGWLLGFAYSQVQHILPCVPAVLFVVKHTMSIVHVSLLGFAITEKKLLIRNSCNLVEACCVMVLHGRV